MGAQCGYRRFGPFGNGVNFRDTESVPVNLVQSSSLGAVRCSHHLNIYSMQMGRCTYRIWVNINYRVDG